MKRKILIFGIFAIMGACRTGHDFTLRDGAAVNSQDAPAINILVKKRITNLAGDVAAEDGASIKVAEVAPSKSFLTDFDEVAFTRIVKASCDKSVVGLRIQSRTEKSALVVWSGKYTASLTIEADDQYTISCSESSL